MKFSTMIFVSAGIVGVFAEAAPTSWPRHLAGAAVCLIMLWIGLGFAGVARVPRNLLWAAVGFVVALVVGGRRVDMRASQRELDRAYRAGRDTGAAEGPTESTLRRWRSEGFTERGISNRDR